MDRPVFVKYLEETFAGILELNKTKGTTYTRGRAEVFTNFQSVGKELNLSQKKVLWVYLRKHLDALLHRIENPESDSDPEDTQSRIQDCILYLALLGAMFKEQNSMEEP